MADYVHTGDTKLVPYRNFNHRMKHSKFNQSSPIDAEHSLQIRMQLSLGVPHTHKRTRQMNSRGRITPSVVSEITALHTLCAGLMRVFLR